MTVNKQWPKLEQHKLACGFDQLSGRPALHADEQHWSCNAQSGNTPVDSQHAVLQLLHRQPGGVAQPVLERKVFRHAQRVIVLDPRFLHRLLPIHMHLPHYSRSSRLRRLLCGRRTLPLSLLGQKGEARVHGGAIAGICWIVRGSLRYSVEARKDSIRGLRRENR